MLEIFGKELITVITLSSLRDAYSFPNYLTLWNWNIQSPAFFSFFSFVPCIIDLVSF